jgi:hypothetical protein
MARSRAGVDVAPGERGEQVERQNGGDHRDGDCGSPTTTARTATASAFAGTNLGVGPGRGPNNMSALPRYASELATFNFAHTRP